jgi:hypothetical protein
MKLTELNYRIKLARPLCRFEVCFIQIAKVVRMSFEMYIQHLTKLLVNGIPLIMDVLIHHVPSLRILLYMEPLVNV